MPSTTLTLNLPPEDLRSLQSFASQHGMSVADLIGRFARGLKTNPPASIHPEVLALTGLLPADLDAELLHRQHLLGKHR